ncbi:COG0762 Predicted integral membrane protein [Candidatus Nanopelagicaceae bacterium]|jgi:YggT family protein
MFSIGGLIADILQLFLFSLFLRLVLDYVRMAKPDWRPRGVLLIAADFIYAITDKPLNFVRRFVKPLRIGGISIDLSFLILFIVISRIAPLLRGF